MLDLGSTFTLGVFTHLGVCLFVYAWVCDRFLFTLPALDEETAVAAILSRSLLSEDTPTPRRHCSAPPNMLLHCYDTQRAQFYQKDLTTVCLVFVSSMAYRFYSA